MSIYISPTGKTIADLTLDNNTYVFENPTGQITGVIVNAMYQNIINTLPFSGASNVILSNSQNNQVLTYNGTKWINKSLSLTSNTDVTLSAPVLNNFLQYNGTYWTNKPLSLSGISDVTFLTSPIDNQFLLFTGGSWRNVSIPGSFNVYQNGILSYLSGATTYIEFGGSLVKNTTLDITGFVFKISGDTIDYNDDYSALYNIRSLVDKGYVVNNYYNSAQTNSNFLSANTSYYTQAQANANFLSATTSVYTQAQCNANFLSSNTTYCYTQAQSNANFLSANTNSFLRLTLTSTGGTAAGSAPLKLTSGATMTNPEVGAIEFDGTQIFYTDSGSTRQTLIPAAYGQLTYGYTSAGTFTILTNPYPLFTNITSNLSAGISKYTNCATGYNIVILNGGAGWYRMSYRVIFSNTLNNAGGNIYAALQINGVVNTKTITFATGAFNTITTLTYNSLYPVLLKIGDEIQIALSQRYDGFTSYTSTIYAIDISIDRIDVQ